jgi:hypothetical protein
VYKIGAGSVWEQVKRVENHADTRKLEVSVSYKYTRMMFRYQ